MSRPGFSYLLVAITRGAALAAAGLLTVSSATVALAATVPATGGKIVRVTVYPDRAEVVREVEVKLPAGASQIQFEGVPANVEADSLRISGKGVAATIGAVEVREVAHDADVSAEYKAADAEVKKLEAQGAALEAQDAISNQLRSYLDSLRATNALRQGEAIAATKPDPLSMKAMLDFLRSGYTDLATQDLERRAQRPALAESLKVARAKRDAARPQGSIRSRVAVVDVTAAAAGSLQVELSYVAPGAYWRPAYRATLDADKAEIDLVSEAVVTQSTGEDWNDVALVLSTAAPARGIESPVLTSWLLQPYVPQPMAKMRRGEPAAYDNALSGSAEGGVEGGVVGGIMGGIQESMPQQVASNTQTSEIIHTAYNAAFAIAGKSDIAADGAEHRVTLRRDTMTAQLAYRVVPSVQEEAFALALTSAPNDRPLLSGPMRVVAGGAYLGAFDVPETAPGAELRVPFGVDNRLKVKRTVLPQARSTEGFIGKDRQMVFAYRTSVENFRDVAVTVVVEERLPISQDERITVKVGDKTSAGYISLDDRPGIINWKFTLAPKEKKELTLEYSVRWPKELQIPGL